MRLNLPKINSRGQEPSSVTGFMAVGGQPEGPATASTSGSPSVSVSGRIPSYPHPKAAESPIISRHFSEGSPISVFSEEHSVYNNKMHEEPELQTVSPSDMAEQLLLPVKAAILCVHRWIVSLDVRDILWVAALVMGVFAALLGTMVSLWIRRWLTADACPEPRLGSFLQEYRLSQYSQQLCQQGYELLEDLGRASESDLEAAGILLRPHRLRILNSATVYAKQWSWIGTVAFRGGLLALLTGASIAAILLLVPAIRVRVQTAAAVAALVLWQKLLELARFWQSIEVPRQPAETGINGEASLSSSTTSQREEYLPLSTRAVGSLSTAAGSMKNSPQTRPVGSPIIH